MSELDDAIARLEAAVARLDVASGDATHAPDDGQSDEWQVSAAAAAIVGRIDAALAKLEQLLEAED
jgi:hypothetical protein